MRLNSEVVICGAGIAGISTAYHLAVHQGMPDVLLVDERPPLSLSSDKSTECYRNWWPGPGDAMVALMNRSIDWLETLADESGNIFHLNRRGYLYLTADPDSIPNMQAAALETSALGAGPLRVHAGRAGDPTYIPAEPEAYRNQPEGADLILEPQLIRSHYPYLSPDVVAALHVRRAGWFSAQQLGKYLLDCAVQHGVRLINARVTGVDLVRGRVRSVLLDNARSVSTPTFVNAAGPYIRQVAKMVGVDLPVFNELHRKASIKDYQDCIPRHAPLLIWSDPQRLPWSQDERALLAEDEETAWLLDTLPPGVHTRPEGGEGSQILLLLWEYHTDMYSEPVYPLPENSDYPEIALRGLAAMIPALQTYIGRTTRPFVDGGYYTKTRENRPLIGPLPVPGAYVIGALSGYGLMAALGAGELLACHITAGDLPHYAPDFRLDRYQDPAYLQDLENWGSSGQL